MQFWANWGIFEHTWQQSSQKNNLSFFPSLPSEFYTKIAIVKMICLFLWDCYYAKNPESDCSKPFGKKNHLKSFYVNSNTLTYSLVYFLITLLYAFCFSFQPILFTSLITGSLLLLSLLQALFQKYWQILACSFLSILHVYHNSEKSIVCSSFLWENFLLSNSS